MTASPLAFRPVPAGASPAKPSGAPAGYIAGRCNIGPAEIARRRRFGHLGVLASVTLLAVLVASGAPREWRLLLFFPAAGAAIGYLQARLRFCAAFGLRGVLNFGRLGEATRIADREALLRDRRRALALIAASALIGLGVAAGAFFL